MSLSILCACGGGGGDAPPDESPDPRVVEGRIQLAFAVPGDGWRKAVLFEECEQGGQPQSGLGEIDVAFVPNDRCLIRLTGMELGELYLVPAAQAAELAIETGARALLSVRIEQALVDYVEALSAEATPAHAQVTVTETGFSVSAPAQLVAGSTEQCVPYRLKAPEGKPLLVTNDNARLLRLRYVYIDEQEHGPELALPSASTFEEQVKLARDELCEKLEFPDPETEEYPAGLEPQDGTVLERLDPNDEKSAPKRIQLGDKIQYGRVLLRCDYICKKCGETEPTEAQNLEEMKPEIHAEAKLMKMPVIAISTVDSSVEYARLCVFEGLSGTYSFPAECDYYTYYQQSAGSCVLEPLQRDRDAYNGDRVAFADALEDGFPVASAILSATGFCWSGTKDAVITAGEADPMDTFGTMHFAVTGSSATARLAAGELQNTFELLYNKHGFTDKEGTATLLFDVDNSGSIRVDQWPASSKSQFLSWLSTEYPNVTVRETTIANYQVDGEDWLRRQLDNYERLKSENE